MGANDQDAPASAPQTRADTLTAVQRERAWPNVKPRNAATLIVLDTSGAKPTVLMGKRHAAHKFMPGKFVFPGGRIEEGDRRMASLAELSPIVQEKLLKRRVRPTPSRPRALALAAIRETFEETGLLLGRENAAGADPLSKAPAGVWRAFAGHGITPDLSQVHFIARAITPPRRPKRFDTTFFAIDAAAIAHRIDGVVTPDAELVELVWTPLRAARDLDLPHITRVVLEELEIRLADGLRDDAPTPFYYEIGRKWRREDL